MKMPPLPELPFLPETPEQRIAMVRWATDYGHQVRKAAARVCEEQSFLVIARGTGFCSGTEACRDAILMNDAPEPPVQFCADCRTKDECKAFGCDEAGLSEEQIRLLWADHGGWSNECPYEFARELLRTNAARPVAFHDKDQPEGIAWCPGYPEGLKDITPLYIRPAGVKVYPACSATVPDDKCPTCKREGLDWHYEVPSPLGDTPDQQEQKR